jgi:hypothetical protein
MVRMDKVLHHGSAHYKRLHLFEARHGSAPESQTLRFFS